MFFYFVSSLIFAEHSVMKQNKWGLLICCMDTANIEDTG